MSQTSNDPYIKITREILIIDNEYYITSTCSKMVQIIWCFTEEFFQIFLNDDKVGDIFIKSGRLFQSLVVDGKKLSMYDVVLI